MNTKQTTLKRFLASLLLLLTLIPIRSSAQNPNAHVFTVELGNSSGANPCAICADPVNNNCFFVAYATPQGCLISAENGWMGHYAVQLEPDIYVLGLYKTGNDVFFCGYKKLSGNKHQGVVGHIDATNIFHSTCDYCFVDDRINMVLKIAAYPTGGGIFKVIALGVDDANVTTYPTLIMSCDYHNGDFNTINTLTFAFATHQSQLQTYGEKFFDILDCGSEWVVVGTAFDMSDNLPAISVRRIDKSTLAGITSPGTMLKVRNHSLSHAYPTHVGGAVIAIASDDIPAGEQVVYTYNYRTNAMLSAQKITRNPKGGIYFMKYVPYCDSLVLCRQDSPSGLLNAVTHLKPIVNSNYVTYESGPRDLSLLESGAVTNGYGFSKNLLAIFSGARIMVRDYTVVDSVTDCFKRRPVEVCTDKFPVIETIPPCTPSNSRSIVRKVPNEIRVNNKLICQ